MRILIVSIFVSLFFSGCAANPEKVKQVAETEAARLTEPSRSLSSYASFELKPMIFSEGILEEKSKLEEGKEFEANLANKLNPLIKSWNADARGEGTLTIQPELSSLRIISGGARFWAGGLVGQSHIDMNLKLIDATTGSEIANPQIRRGAGAIAGAWSIGKSDQNLDEYIVSIVYEYLEDSY